MHKHLNYFYGPTGFEKTTNDRISQLQVVAGRVKLDNDSDAAKSTASSVNDSGENSEGLKNVDR